MGAPETTRLPAGGRDGEVVSLPSPHKAPGRRWWAEAATQQADIPKTSGIHSRARAG